MAESSLMEPVFPSSLIESFPPSLSLVSDTTQPENVKDRSDDKTTDVLIEIIRHDIDSHELMSKYDFPDKIFKDIPTFDKYDIKDYTYYKSEEESDFEEFDFEPYHTPESILLKADADRINAELQDACLKGDLNVVMGILHKHDPRIMPDTKGRTPLHYACMGNQREVIEYIVHRG